MRIALAGNPNSGKTTLFNRLTGASQHVGNWPGVTVEKKEGRLRGQDEVELMDLPGIYSLSPYTLEEVIARDYLLQEQPDLILNIVDGTNLERNLYLTTQLLELGMPLVVAVNMADVVQRRKQGIDYAALSEQLGCPVVAISALRGRGVDALVELMLELASVIDQPVAMPTELRFSPELEEALTAIGVLTGSALPEGQARWGQVKLFERDPDLRKRLDLSEETNAAIETVIQGCEEACDDDAESIISSERYGLIARILETGQAPRQGSGLSASDRIDQVVTNRWLALPIFVAVMFVVYYVSITTVGTWATDWANDVLFGEYVPEAVRGFLQGVGTAPWMESLVVDGILAGVGAVLGFLPQMLVLFLFLAFLEGCGYMARIAFILDRMFRRFGLSGKSFIPMLIGTGCSVPGIMASRTIESVRDRRMTIITTSFMPCSAKLPVIGLIAGALFGGVWWVAPTAYFIGIAAIICSGIILKKTKRFAGEASPFVMELPDYHWPTVGSVVRSTWERGRSFIIKAGTIILLSTIVTWFTSSYGWVGGRIVRVEDLNEGFLASLGQIIAPLFAPLGWGQWRPTVAAITGLVAKENVVSSFGILYGFAEVAEAGQEIWQLLALEIGMLAGFSFLVFNLLCAPCFAAIGAMRRELGSVGWTLFAVAYQTGLAYAVSLVIYQMGRWFTGGGFGVGTAVAVALILGFVYLLIRPEPKSRPSDLGSVLRSTGA